MRHHPSPPLRGDACELDQNAVRITLSLPAINQWRLDNGAQTLRCHTCALKPLGWRRWAPQVHLGGHNQRRELKGGRQHLSEVRRGHPHIRAVRRLRLPARRPLAGCKVIPGLGNVSPTFFIVIPRFGRGDAAERRFRFPSGIKCFTQWQRIYISI